MRAFNQSVSSQVSAAMRLPDRLVQRSQPPAHLAPRRLGEPAAEAVAVAGASGEQKIANGDDGEEGDEEGLAAAAAARGEERVPELYDDADFYEQVLKEFLESAGEAGLGGVGGGAVQVEPVECHSLKTPGFNH